MKIVYISRLDGEDWQGPTYSVPKQVKAQSQYDEVFWVNINGISKDDWKKTNLFYVLNKNMQITLDDVIKMFGEIDLIIFEGVYEYPFMRLITDLWKAKIPYVIVPRSALSIEGQKRKYLKKLIGNTAFFGRFIKRASAIHYLTLAEKDTSISFGNKNSLVLPNGIDLPNQKKEYTQIRECYRLIYIGRLEIYQKGFDILIDACRGIKDVLLENNVEIHLFGPNYESTVERINKLIKDYSLKEIIFVHDGVFGDQKKMELLDADAFIMTSRFEGLSMALIEALSYGLPCLVTTGTNMESEIVEGNAGWGAECSASSVKDALLKFIDDRKIINQYGANARNLASKYSWDYIAKQSHNEYLKLINRK